VKIKAPLNIEENCLISNGGTITGKNVIINIGTNIMPNTELVGPVEIGKYCAIARNSVLQGHNHYSKVAGIQNKFYKDKFNERLSSLKKGKISVGNDVWIGTKVNNFARVLKLVMGLLLGTDLLLLKMLINILYYHNKMIRKRSFFYEFKS
jgi:hypothetical protein